MFDLRFFFGSRQSRVRGKRLRRRHGGGRRHGKGKFTSGGCATSRTNDHASSKLSAPQAEAVREKGRSLHPAAREAQHQRIRKSSEGKIDKLSRHWM